MLREGSTSPWSMVTFSDQSDSALFFYFLPIFTQLLYIAPPPTGRTGEPLKTASFDMWEGGEYYPLKTKLKKRNKNMLGNAYMTLHFLLLQKWFLSSISWRRSRRGPSWWWLRSMIRQQSTLTATDFSESSSPHHILTLLFTSSADSTRKPGSWFQTWAAPWSARWPSGTAGSLLGGKASRQRPHSSR